MARAPVPTVDFFRSKASKPDAFKTISNEDLADMLAGTTDYVASFLSKRAKGVITAWDNSFPRAIVALTAKDAMTNRGYNKSAGADAAIESQAQQTEKWLVMVSEGGVEPWFTDETDDADDAPLGGSSANSDEWTQ